MDSADPKIIGAREMYSSKSAMENGIRSINESATTAEAADLV
ncbi:MAG: YegP family protein [Candidatus Tectomicrobia bacterium]|nr:YegP family protein [Candidatus Tectomicrobia bacterium]